MHRAFGLHLNHTASEQCPPNGQITPRADTDQHILDQFACNHPQACTPSAPSFQRQYSISARVVRCRQIQRLR